MNERIRELWTQSTFNVVPRTGDYSSVSAEHIEKFTELIMKETFDWVVENVGLMENTEWEALKKHFGVD